MDRSTVDPVATSSVTLSANQIARQPSARRDINCRKRELFSHHHCSSVTKEITTASFTPATTKMTSASAVSETETSSAAAAAMPLNVYGL